MINITHKKNLEEAFAQDFGSPYFPILAELYLQEGDIRRAKIVCKLGLEHGSMNDCGKFILAKIALAEGKFTLAERWLKQVINENPSNFNALRILIRLEISLKRSSITIKKYIQHILHYIPKDIECRNWLRNISDRLQEDKGIITSKKNDDENLNGNPKIVSKPIKDNNYNVKKSMATFTMLKVLKSQKHYKQALTILKMMEAENLDAERILKERSEIQDLLTKASNA